MCPELFSDLLIMGVYDVFMSIQACLPELYHPASSVHYSFIETAKANDIEPYAYLVDVLTRLPYADTVEKLEELLPWNFKKSESEKIKDAAD